MSKIDIIKPNRDIRTNAFKLFYPPNEVLTIPIKNKKS